MATRTRLNLEGLTKIKARMDATIKSALVTTAIAIRDDARELAPKDTTALAESIYVATTEASDYEEATGAARQQFDQAKAIGHTPKGVRLGPKSELKLFDEIDMEPGKVYVPVAAEHGYVNEFGDVHRGPQAFLFPSVEANAAKLAATIRTGLSGVSGRSGVTGLTELDQTP